MTVDDEVLAEFGARFGTPLYAYDTAKVLARLAELAKALPDGAQLLYSFKANPLPALAAHLRECGPDVSSAGEVAAAIEAGFDMSRGLYSGPAKSSRNIEHAIDAGIGYFSVESSVELARLSQCAARRAVRPRALLRIRPDNDHVAGLIMDSRTHFGFASEGVADELRRSLIGVGNVQITGLHVYSGTQQRDPATLVHLLAFARRLARRLQDLLPDEPAIIDLGGGFAWPFATSGASAQLSDALAPLRAAAEQWPSRLWFESGRYLVASSGTLITQVLDVRRIPGRRSVVVLDGGINTLGGLSGLGRLLRPEVTPRRLSTRPGDNADDESYDLVGPLCTPVDVVAIDVRLPAPRPGDLLAIPNVGAYGLTTGLVAFLSHPLPAEIVHCRGRILEVSRMKLTRTTTEAGAEA